MKNLSPSVCILLAVLTIGGFAVGRFTAPSSSSPAETVNPSSAARLSSARDATETSRNPARRDPNAAAPSELSGGQVRTALQQLDKGVGSEEREQERLKLLVALAATDPLGAIEYAKRNLKGDRLAQGMSGIATEWARRDPAAAWTWARSFGNDAAQAHTVLEEIGHNDPATATRLAGEFARQQPDEAVAMCMTAMRAITFNGNYDAARKLATEMQLRSPEEQNMLVNFMAGQWARYEPEKAAQWVQSLPAGPAREQALIGLASSWADRDPPKAAEFAATLPPGESRSVAMRQAVANWVQSDPMAARKWVIESNQYQDFDAAVEAIATQNNFVSREPAHALVWATGIFDEKLRLKTMNTILFNWYSMDRNAATTYLQNSQEFTPEQRADLLQKLQSSSG